MPPESDDPLSVTDAAALWDVLPATQEPMQFLGNATFTAYKSDLILRRALERDLSIIGEAARRVRATFRTEVKAKVVRLIGERQPLVPGPPEETGVEDA